RPLRTIRQPVRRILHIRSREHAPITQQHRRAHPKPRIPRIRMRHHLRRPLFQLLNLRHKKTYCTLSPPCDSSSSPSRSSSPSPPPPKLPCNTNPAMTPSPDTSSPPTPNPPPANSPPSSSSTSGTESSPGSSNKPRNSPTRDTSHSPS